MAAHEEKIKQGVERANFGDGIFNERKREVGGGGEEVERSGDKAS
ncbi:15266_t:CDS:2, partial [Entrophospora sp. SA101]